MLRAIPCLCPQTPAHLCVGELVSHSRKTSTNTTAHGVDTAHRVNCFDCSSLFRIYANVFPVLFIVWTLFPWLHLIRSGVIEQYSALVFTISEQASLPPDQKPLGSCGHINQLWPRSVLLIGREAGLEREGFLHSLCLHAAPMVPACVCKWIIVCGRQWVIFYLLILLQRWWAFKFSSFFGKSADWRPARVTAVWSNSTVPEFTTLVVPHPKHKVQVPCLWARA